MAPVPISSTGCLCVRLTRHGEAVQIQGHIRRANGEARRASDRARHITNELAVIHDRQRRSNGPADIRGAGAPGAHKENTEKRDEPCTHLQTSHLDPLSQPNVPMK